MFFKDVVGNELLFPLFNFTNVDEPLLNQDGLIVIENDIGSFGKCEVEAESFDVSKLSFEVVELLALKQSFISGIKYDDQPLIFKKKESLFNGKVLIIKNS